MFTCQPKVKLHFLSDKKCVLSVRLGNFLTFSYKSQTKWGIGKIRKVFLCNVSTALSHLPLTPLTWEGRWWNRSLALLRVQAHKWINLITSILPAKDIQLCQVSLSILKEIIQLSENINNKGHANVLKCPDRNLKKWI